MMTKSSNHQSICIHCFTLVQHLSLQEISDIVSEKERKKETTRMDSTFLLYNRSSFIKKENIVIEERDKEPVMSDNHFNRDNIDDGNQMEFKLLGERIQYLTREHEREERNVGEVIEANSDAEHQFEEREMHDSSQISLNRKEINHTNDKSQEQQLEREEASNHINQEEILDVESRKEDNDAVESRNEDNDDEQLKVKLFFLDEEINKIQTYIQTKLQELELKENETTNDIDQQLIEPLDREESNRRNHEEILDVESRNEDNDAEQMKVKLFFLDEDINIIQRKLIDFDSEHPFEEREMPDSSQISLNRKESNHQNDISQEQPPEREESNVRNEDNDDKQLKLNLPNLYFSDEEIKLQDLEPKENNNNNQEQQHRFDKQIETNDEESDTNNKEIDSNNEIDTKNKESEMSDHNINRETEIRIDNDNDNDNEAKQGIQTAIEVEMEEMIDETNEPFKDPLNEEIEKIEKIREIDNQTETPQERIDSERDSLLIQFQSLNNDQQFEEEEPTILLREEEKDEDNKERENLSKIINYPQEEILRPIEKEINQENRPKIQNRNHDNDNDNNNNNENDNSSEEEFMVHFHFESSSEEEENNSHNTSKPRYEPEKLCKKKGEPNKSIVSTRQTESRKKKEKEKAIEKENFKLRRIKTGQSAQYKCNSLVNERKSQSVKSTKIQGETKKNEIARKELINNRRNLIERNSHLVHHWPVVFIESFDESNNNNINNNINNNNNASIVLPKVIIEPIIEINNKKNNNDNNDNIIHQPLKKARINNNSVKVVNQKKNVKMNQVSKVKDRVKTKINKRISLK